MVKVVGVAARALKATHEWRKNQVNQEKRRIFCSKELTVKRLQQQVINIVIMISVLMRIFLNIRELFLSFCFSN